MLIQNKSLVLAHRNRTRHSKQIEINFPLTFTFYISTFSEMTK